MKFSMRRQGYTLAALCGLVAIAMTPAQAALTFNPANGHYYDFITGSRNWFDANTHAQGQFHLGFQGHLATITDSAEDAFIFNTFVLPAPSDQKVSWLGGFQPIGSTEPSGGWQWVTGETWSYTNWGAGEPNNAGFLGEGGLEYRTDSKWNDANRLFETNKAYVIEYDVPSTVPEPGSMALLGSGVLGIFHRLRRRKLAA